MTITFLLTVITIVYVYVRMFIFSYWTRRGIPTYKKTEFPFGHFKPVLMQKQSSGELVQSAYQASPTERMIGIYAIFRPMLIVRDPELVQRILINDFCHFTDRGMHMDEKRDPLTEHLVTMRGAKWKNLRVKLTPLFTSGKLKSMISTILNAGQTLQDFVGKMASTGNMNFEMCDISARYTTNSIASIAFGIDINSIDNPNEPFRRYGRKVYMPAKTT